MNNKKGSSVVMLAIIFVSLMAAIVASITISRALVVKSECESFGTVWARAILSEYDVHLLEDYSVMAYQGNEKLVSKKISSYLDYSCEGKLDASIETPYSNLCGYELSNPDNFGKAIKNSLGKDAIKLLIEGSARTTREETGEENTGTHIDNTVVLDTLPSRGIESKVNVGELASGIKEGKDYLSLDGEISDIPLSIAYMYKYLSNNVSYTDQKPHLFKNEWEYVLIGNYDDRSNYRECRNKIFILRNVLNLAAVYSDSCKAELVQAIAQLLTPGPTAVATQAVIAELWAAAETEEDLKTLYGGGRVPIIKSAGDWKTDLGVILDTDEFSSKLDEQARTLLNEQKEEIGGLITNSGVGIAGEFKDGLNYDGYLILLLSAVNSRVRMLRIMDIVQINMKYRYYRDFNMSEYYTGVGFTLKANGRDYEINDKYK